MSINEVRWLSECGSTNAYAKEHFEEFGPVGAVYTTNQTAGRGRLGRSWVNAEGRALYYTAVIREPLAQPATLPLLASLAVRDQLAQRYGVDCQIKWPNDLLLYGKKTVSRWGFRHSVLEVTRRPVCHVLLQRCAGADMLDDAEAQAQLDEAAQLLTEAGFVQYLPRRWAKPGCEDKFWQGAANGMDVLAFGLSAYTRLDGMITTNTSDLNTYLAHSADYEQITVSTVPVQTAE